MDFKEMSVAELEYVIDNAKVELDRRQFLEGAAERVEELVVQVLTAEGVSSGDEWRQPTGAHDAYPEGWQATWNDKTWTSLTSGNVWEPGVSGWREEGGDGEAPEWVQPTGGHDAYSVGDRVTFEGKVYESTLNSNTWSPAAYPAGWKEV